MTKTENISMDAILTDLGKCGRFQVIIVFTVHLCKFMLAFCTLFMSFGNYNPGWRCLDNATNMGSSMESNVSWSHVNGTPQDFTVDSCHIHYPCQIIEFNPESSTVVTEWGLICDRSWIISIIISIQMAGFLVGAALTGYLGDRFGRKYTLMSSVFVLAVVNFVVVFSVSWQMFAVCRFMIGVVSSSFRFLPFVYSSEFIPPKWRVPVSSIPFFSIASIFFAVLCMLTKDWKLLHIVSGSASIIVFIVMAWMPRSIRWLIVHEKEKEAFQVATMIAKCNGKPMPNQRYIQSLIDKHNNEKTATKRFLFFYLFRTKTILISFLIGFVYLTLGITYFAISFGIKSLPGDIYVNLIIIFSTANFANIYSSIAANYWGRRVSLMASFITASVCLFGVVLFDRYSSSDTKDNTILSLAIIARICTSSSWYIMAAYMAELYPTVTRSSITGWGSLNAQIGAIVAPYLIPNKQDELYICYTIMGCFNIVCCFLFLLLPETTGKTLQDVLTSDVETSQEDSL